MNGPRVIASLVRGLAVAAVVSAALGILGPFGTYGRMEVVERLAFWSAVIFGGMFFHVPVYWLGAWIGETRRIGP